MRLVCLAIVSSLACHARADALATPVDVYFSPLATRCVHAQIPRGEEPPPHAQLVLVDGVKPIGLATRTADDPSDVYRLTEAAAARVRFGRQLEAWLIPSAAAAPIAAWPSDIPFAAQIDSLSPAQSAAWLAVGSRHGVRVGDSWWLRVGRQPAARLDIRFAADDVAYATVTPLAMNLALNPGQPVQRWRPRANDNPGPLRSAVAHVERQGADMAIWIAAPIGVDVPSEPHVDFFRAGRWTGHGLVQRADERFWYAGLISETAGVPQVGDDAAVRTRAEIVARRVTARVFDRTERGAVIDAGEQDGFAVGQSAMGFREGAFLTRIEITHVQPTYSIVTASPPAGETAPALAIGDQVRLTPPPPAPKPAGEIVAVVDEQLVVVRLADAPALATPLLVEHEGESVALVVLLAADGPTGVGYRLPRSGVAALTTGMRVLRPGVDEGAHAPPSEPQKPRDKSR